MSRKAGKPATSQASHNHWINVAFLYVATCRPWGILQPSVGRNPSIHKVVGYKIVWPLLGRAIFGAIKKNSLGLNNRNSIYNQVTGLAGIVYFWTCLVYNELSITMMRKTLGCTLGKLFVGLLSCLAVYFQTSRLKEKYRHVVK